MTDQNIIFKNNKTGKVEQINSADMEFVNYQRFVGSLGLRIFMKNGTLHRYMGLKTGEEDKIAGFFKKHYQKDMLEKELSLKVNDLQDLDDFQKKNLLMFEIYH